MFIHVYKTFQALLCQMSGKYFLKKREIQKHLHKNHKHSLVSSQRYQDSRHILRNPKVLNDIMGFNCHAQTVTGPNYLDVDTPLEFT